MPVGIRIFDAPQTSQISRQGNLVNTIYGENMLQALLAVARWAQHHELAGEGPDSSLYAYDCLGGMRFEAHRRSNVFSARVT